MEHQEHVSGTNVNKLVRLVVLRFGLIFVVMGLLFFLPAGSLRYWQAWVFCAVLFVPMIFVLFYLLKNDPGLLERRMRVREREKSQKLCITLGTPLYIAAYAIPGFDYRFSWSSVPVSVVIVGDILVFCGYMLFFFVLRENSYASRVVEVEKNQKVISTGPYAVVRHPMYLAALSMLCFSPLALGSFWMLIAVIPLCMIFIVRIKSEETLLSKELSGYSDYCRKVRYRLIPLIW